MPEHSSQNPPAEFTHVAFAFLCLTISLALLALGVTAMRLTAAGELHLHDSSTMAAVIGILFWTSFARLLKCLTVPEDEDDEDLPLHTAGRLFRTIVIFAPVPIAIYVGGRLSPDEPRYGWLTGGLLALPLLWLFWPRPGLSQVLLRGTLLLAMSQAKRRAAQLVHPQEPTLNWIGVYVPERVGEHHFLLVGGTGGGKTTAERRLMQCVLPSITPGSDRRALVYDAKQDMMEILSGLPLSCDVVVLNPCDARSVAWDLAQDIVTPTAAMQFASTIIEDEKGANSFFSKAARDLFGNVMTALHHTRPRDWTLADVLHTLSSAERTRTLLESVPCTRDVATQHFERDDKTLSNVLYTISANIAVLRPIAALWYHARRRFSLHGWITSNSILVLGNMEDLRYPIDAVNRALFQRIVELVLSQSESSTRRTWFFLDEVKEMGRLDALPRLLTKGRSKGVRAVLAFQTIEGLSDVYGEKLAGEITGMAANKCFFRTDSEETARWAARIIGEAEYREWTQTISPDGRVSASDHFVKKDAVLPSQILRLPLVDHGRFWSYCVTPSIGVYHGFTYLADGLCPKGSAPNFIPRPNNEQYLPHDLYPVDEPQGPSLDDIGRIRFRNDQLTPDDDIDVIP